MAHLPEPTDSRPPTATRLTPLPPIERPPTSSSSSSSRTLPHRRLMMGSNSAGAERSTPEEARIDQAPSPLKRDGSAGAVLVTRPQSARRTLPPAPAHPHPPTHAGDDVPPVDKVVRTSSASQADTSALNEINDILVQLTPTLDDMTRCYMLCDRLAHLLAHHSIKSGKVKGTILRSLFRLLDLKDARLLVKLAHLILQVLCCC